MTAATPQEYFTKENRVRLFMLLVKAIEFGEPNSYGGWSGGEQAEELDEVLCFELGRYRVAHGRSLINQYQTLVDTAPEADLLTMIGLVPIAIDAAARKQRGYSPFNRANQAPQAVEMLNWFLESIGHPARFNEKRQFVRDAAKQPIVEPPSLTQMSEAARHALDDALVLQHQRGAVSSLDREHTQVQAYLKAVCDSEGIEYSNNPELSELFKLIRERHSAFKQQRPMQNDAMKALSTVVHFLNPARNKHTPVHDNETLLEPPEAILLINAMRALLQYLDARLHSADGKGSATA